MYFDDWAIANVANLGTNFNLGSGSNQRIVSQVAQGNATGTTIGWYRHNSSMASDNFRVSAKIVAAPNGTALNTLNTYLLVRNPNTFSTSGNAGRYVLCGFKYDGTWTMWTVVSGTTTTQVAQGTASFADGDIIALEAMGNVFTAYKNNDPISGARWVDASNTVGTGSLKRRWGPAVQCAATNQQGPALDFIAATDATAQFFAVT